MAAKIRHLGYQFGRFYTASVYFMGLQSDNRLS
jgi:hypothetical protein